MRTSVDGGTFEKCVRVCEEGAMWCVGGRWSGGAIVVVVIVELESRDAHVADDFDVLPLLARLVLLHGIVRRTLQSKVGNLIQQ